MAQTNKGYNEDTYLNQIRVCNHWQSLLSFVWRVHPSEKEGKPLFMFWFPMMILYHVWMVLTMNG